MTLANTCAEASPAAPPLFAVLDDASATMERAFHTLPGFAPLALAPELATMAGSYAGKTLALRASAFTAAGVQLGRVVRIDGPGTWILNAVVFPSESYATPILGIELLVFRDRMHLIVADLYPLREADSGVMDDIGPRFDDVGDPPDMPQWATRIFSRRPVFRKPRSSATLADGARAVRLVADRWLSFATVAVPVDDDVGRSTRARRNAYIRSHAEDEPANPFLAKTFGDVLGKRLVDEVLFPHAAFR